MSNLDHWTKGPPCMECIAQEEASIETSNVLLSERISCLLTKPHWEFTKKKQPHWANPLITDSECFRVGLTLPPGLMFIVVKTFFISRVMALSTLPDDIFLCDFCKCSLRELVLRPAFFPQTGHTFISGFLCCHSIEGSPCSFLSRSKRIFANPSLGWARRWTLFSVFHASKRVKFLPKLRKF